MTVFDHYFQLRWKPFPIPDEATAKVDFVEVNFGCCL